ncbi:CheR family methyltransferase [Sphingobacterium spiritivorum]|uniref:CheR family methyltransferase n=1 Tax=Sphingobacterium spiritivorum TaxID=258 RepID=UPI0019193A65|nr:protein-glutamate O-methyltransferase CheR [Sphingobacterium spiritivorum]QQT24243.1 protein-glutamate O-methyltransferase CheR [Sphingobacterium spiritivorum]
MISFSELEELIELVKNVNGMDLSGYSRASLKRRVTRLMEIDRMDLVALKTALVNTPGYFNHFIIELTVNVTEMFRDPFFYKAMREDVFPYLASFPRIKSWSAGCSSGEEVYSLAILLKEAGLYERSFIYGTDINNIVLEQAKKGIYSLQKIKDYSDNFLKSGTVHSLSDYYTAMYDAASINNDLKKNILFSSHNLVSDGVFNEFQLITCRNVLIYFDLELQQSVIRLFYESLCLFGFLCLGSKETLHHQEIASKFKLINKKYNIYQKIA